MTVIERFPKNGFTCKYTGPDDGGEYLEEFLSEAIEETIYLAAFSVLSHLGLILSMYAIPVTASKKLGIL